MKLLTICLGVFIFFVVCDGEWGLERKRKKGKGKGEKNLICIELPWCK